MCGWDSGGRKPIIRGVGGEHERRSDAVRWSATGGEVRAVATPAAPGQTEESSQLRSRRSNSRRQHTVRRAGETRHTTTSEYITHSVGPASNNKRCPTCIRNQTSPIAATRPSEIGNQNAHAPNRRQSGRTRSTSQTYYRACSDRRCSLRSRQTSVAMAATKSATIVRHVDQSSTDGRSGSTPLSLVVASTARSNSVA